jgi:hypothetical protein
VATQPYAHPRVAALEDSGKGGKWALGVTGLVCGGGEERRERPWSPECGQHGPRTLRLQGGQEKCPQNIIKGASKGEAGEDMGTGFTAVLLGLLMPSTRQEEMPGLAPPGNCLRREPDQGAGTKEGSKAQPPNCPLFARPPGQDTRSRWT